MKPNHYYISLRAMIFSSIFAVVLTCYGQSEPVIAYASKYKCGEFFDGIATVEESYGHYIFVDRHGEKIGEAPGMLIHSDRERRIFDRNNYKKDCFILTDKSNNVIAKSKGDIEYVADGLYYIRNSSFSSDGGKMVDAKGKTLKKINAYPSFYTNDISEYSLVSHGKSGKPQYEVFKSGKYVCSIKGYISHKHLAPNYPFMFFGEKKNKNAYIKATDKILRLKHPNIAYIPGMNYFINYKNNARAPQDFIYIGLNGEILPYEHLATNSEGNKIIYDSATKSYNIIDKYHNNLNKAPIEEVNPYLWQQGVLAAKVNGKWGYYNERGGEYLRFEYEKAGPRAGNICAVVKDGKYQFLYFNDKAKTYNTIATTDIKTNGEWIHSYYTDNIDGNNVLFWERASVTGYGFYNLDTCNGYQDMGEIPCFKDGIACTYIEGSNTYQKCLLSLDGRIKARASEDDGYFKSIGEGLYSNYEMDKEAGHYITKIYTKEGVLVYNSKASGIRMEGNFRDGVAPVYISGGLNRTGEQGSSYSYGYIYNTFSKDLGDVLMNDGNMGQDELSNELNAKLKERIELIDYYQIMGNNALNREDYHAAIEYFNKALDLNCVHWQSRFGKGIAQLSMGEYSEALESLEYCDNISGAQYAKALCYYNLGNYQKAQRCNSSVATDDPAYSQSLELKPLIDEGLEAQRVERELEKQRRWQTAVMILGAISNGLQLISQTMSAAQASQGQSYDAPRKVSNTVTRSSNTKGRRQCSSCNGTGVNSAKERPAFYSYSQDSHSNSPCEICGDRSNHYHKPCPSCGGSGYVNY